MFVDAETDGLVIGPPERLPMHALNYYASATALLSTPPLPKTLSVAEVATIVAGLLEVAGLTSSSGSPANLGELNTLATAGGNLTNVQQEALNVAFHAWQTWRHFRDIGKMTWPPNLPAAGPVPKLTLKVGMGGSELKMGFVPSAVDFNSTITFQTDPGAHGLQSDNNRHVFAPSLDPEVVVHELSHGLMWLLDHSPFDNRLDSVPFSRALIEGYAMYFAHSLLEREDPGQEAWACARTRRRLGQTVEPGDPGRGHPRSTGQKAGRSGGVRGAQLLSRTADNRPAGVRRGHGVGAGLMGCTRHAAKGQAGWQIADRRPGCGRPAGVESYHYVHGWSSNFEMAAEGLIDAAQKLLPEYGASEQHKMKIKGRIIDLFAARGILAERGGAGDRQVAGLAAEQWAIGTDSGLRFTSDFTQPWQNWTELKFKPTSLPGVVGVPVMVTRSTSPPSVGYTVGTARPEGRSLRSPIRRPPQPRPTRRNRRPC